jgi:class 3 adenylate cyclase
LEKTLHTNGKLQTKLVELQAFVGANQSSMDEIMLQRGRVATLSRKVAEARAAKATVEQAREVVEQDMDATAGDLSVAMCVAKALKKKAAMYEREIAELRREREEVEQAIAESRQDLEDRIADAARINTELRAAFERTTANIAALELRHKELQESLARSKEQAVSIMHQIALQDAALAREARAEKRRKEAESLDGKYPTGKVTLVFSDIQCSTQQWDQNPEAMARALRIHDDTMRACVRTFGGYEAKTAGDSFMLAFRSPQAAVRFCLTAQEKLLAAEWPAELLANQWSGVEKSESSGAIIWRGLRVRMGAHTCMPQTQLDPASGRVEYVGVAVNHAARIAAMARGGQVLVSGSTVAGIEEGSLKDVAMEACGEITFGSSRAERLLQLLPVSLASRRFDAVPGG